MDKQAFFAANKPRVISVEVPEANGTFNFQDFSGATRDTVMEIARGDGVASDYEAALVIASVVDENGDPVFTDDDTVALKALNSRALSALALAAMKVNNIGADAEDAAAKN